ncbi:Photosystem I iron-sulfur center [Parasponia andersonii]|uniref:Photosystem I iron-sulfur center n=1 Tax=Parasponia andersonii TaxID=3476 RepID=A0A2P5BU48_PARAD|nr:Photosystem I iron-sulfur center [Parasponia andersonii]
MNAKGRASSAKARQIASAPRTEDCVGCKRCESGSAKAGEIPSALKTEDPVGCKRCEAACPLDFSSVSSFSVDFRRQCYCSFQAR